MRSFIICILLQMLIFKTIKSRRMIRVGNVTCMWEKRSAYRILMGKPEGKGSLGSPRRKSKSKVVPVLN
jgi:hypothetical protein